MDIKEWLINQIAEEAGIEAIDVSCDQVFDHFDMDSLSLVSLSYELESQLKMEISPTVFVEFDTINKLAAWIVSQK